MPRLYPYRHARATLGVWRSLIPWARNTCRSILSAMSAWNLLLLPVALGLGATVGSVMGANFVWGGNLFRAVRLRPVCPHCRRRHSWATCLPLVSWFLLGARWPCCEERMDVRYPLFEGVSGGLAGLFLLVPPTGEYIVDDGVSFNAAVLFLSHTVFASVLFACIVNDFESGVPDSLTDAGVIAGCVAGLLVDELAGRWNIPGLPAPLDRLACSVTGALFAMGFTQGVNLLGTAAFRKPALGMGVVTFMGVVGAFLGCGGFLVVFFLAPIIGLVVPPVVAQVTTVWKRYRIPRQFSYLPYLGITTIGVLYLRRQISAFMAPYAELFRGTEAVWMIVLALAVVYPLYTVAKHRFRPEPAGDEEEGESAD